MKLLLKKKGNRGGKAAINGISIKKSSVYIKGTAFDRLSKDDKPIYGNVGINEEGNLSLYVAYENNDLLYRFYLPKGREKEARFGINTKEQAQALAPYIGNYDIKYVSMQDKGGIFEVVLSKMS